MKTQDFDVLIIGMSPWSLGFALKKRVEQKSIFIIDTPLERPIRGYYKIDKTPFNHQPVLGVDFWDIVIQKFKQVGVEYSIGNYFIQEIELGLNA